MEPIVERPYIYVQWKGTDVCADFWCDCGFEGHFDGMFASYYKCPQCNSVYETPFDLKLRKLTDEEAIEFPKSFHTKVGPKDVAVIPQSDEQYGSH